MSVGPLRALFVSFIFAFTSGLHGARARAQSCHTSDLVEQGEQAERPFRASLGFSFASFDSAGERGNYQSLFTGFGYRHPWFGAELMLPAYRLKRESGAVLGLGDLVFTMLGTVWRTDEGDIALGVTLPTMIPTGNAERQLGMGHVMLMPAAWFSLELRPFALRAQLGYGHALGSEQAHAHHGVALATGRSPLVNPMNRRELEHSLLLSLGLQRQVSAHARWFGGVPVDDGVLRQVLGGGATVSFEPGELLVEVQVPVAADPFDVKFITQLAFGF